MNDDFPFKVETLLEQCGGSKEVGRSILDAFLEQVESDTQEMAASLADGNWMQAGKAGHRLKSTAGVLGASKLHSLCSALETAGKEGKAEAANRAYLELMAEVDRCIAAVPEARKKL